MPRRFVMPVAGLVAVAGLLAGAPGALADGSGAVGGSDPSTGTISAGVYHYWGRWSGRHSACTWTPYTREVALDRDLGGDPVTRLEGGVTYTMFLQACPGQAERVVWIGPGAPRVLLGDARDWLASRLPRPEGGFAPSAERAFVTVPEWFWTTTPFTEVSVTAWVPTVTGGSVWATTTATPGALVLDPGDGSAPITCEGPGEAWDPATGDTSESPCSHVFHHTSLLAPDGRRFHGSLSIDWDIAWSSSTGDGGPLAPIRTTTDVEFTVGEIQAVVGGSGSA